MVTAQTNLFFSLYVHYKKGILPFSGGLLDQPNKYIEAMTLLTTHLIDLDQDPNG